MPACEGWATACFSMDPPSLTVGTIPLGRVPGLQGPVHPCACRDRQQLTGPLGSGGPLATLVTESTSDRVQPIAPPATRQRADRDASTLPASNNINGLLDQGLLRRRRSEPLAVPCASSRH